MNLTHLTRSSSLHATLSALNEKQKEILGVYQKNQKPLGPWQVADQLRKDVYVIRPRITELANMGILEEAGTRREARTCRHETVYQLKYQFQFDDQGQGLIFGDAA